MAQQIFMFSWTCRLLKVVFFDLSKVDLFLLTLGKIFVDRVWGGKQNEVKLDETLLKLEESNEWYQPTRSWLLHFKSFPI
jgi:hypothetical protein